ncbi:MAG TPA: ABC transporter ATP-binding protein [Candidatus Polarisedimenticolaceae bacterium]
MTPPVLRFTGVSKTYRLADGRLHHALHNATAEVPERSRIAVIGRSGSGKSTFLHLAAGIDSPTEGRVELEGHDLASLSEAQRTRLRRDAVGFVFQFFHLLGHLSVVDNVMLPCWIAGDRGDGPRRRALELLERVGLADRAGDPVQKLSGGEMQRVAICRALVRKPRLLLADEPTGNLDDDNSRVVMDLLLRLAAEEGSTLLYVTHSLELAALASARWRLHSGTLETA